MAHTVSARKRIRQSEKRRLANKSKKSAMKTSIKKYLKAVASGDIASAEQLINQSISVLYRTADKGIIHKNQAARRVSRLVKRLNALKAGSAS
jgi:small subunit ribosomal protein S20